jgi:hypothetical protein
MLSNWEIDSDELEEEIQGLWTHPETTEVAGSRK